MHLLCHYLRAAREAQISHRAAPPAAAQAAMSWGFIFRQWPVRQVSEPRIGACAAQLISPLSLQNSVVVAG